MRLVLWLDRPTFATEVSLSTRRSRQIGNQIEMLSGRITIAGWAHRLPKTSATSTATGAVARQV